MIKVTLPDRTLVISFNYTRLNKILRYDLNEETRAAVPVTGITTSTHCKLSELIVDAVDGAEVPRLVGHGHTECVPPDNFSKEVGRKRALTAALKFMRLGKHDRTAVWEAYYDRANPERLHKEV